MSGEQTVLEQAVDAGLALLNDQNTRIPASAAHRISMLHGLLAGLKAGRLIISEPPKAPEAPPAKEEE